MGLRLSVQRRAWRAHLAAVAARTPGLVPVVKGNGYGFGRNTLMAIAAEHTVRDGQIAVGTVYEAADVPADRTALVLTPHLGRIPGDVQGSAILTVGDLRHVEALAAQGWRGRVALKLESSMRRHGAEPQHLAGLAAAVAHAGATTDGYVLHLPLGGDDADRLDEIVTWLPHLDPSLPISVSHLTNETYTRLIAAHPAFQWRMRLGTVLWLSDKQLMHLSADVLAVKAVEGGSVAGYRAVVVPADGHIVLAAAGSAHGVRAHADGRSPFHFARTRIAMLEDPHMHTTMLFVPNGEPLPTIGDRLDVQRPLITITVDELMWTDD